MKEAIVFTNESDFRSWFEENLDQFDIKEIVLSQEVCPDYVVLMKDGKCAKIEAELFAVNFRYHKHDPAKVDYIVSCYSKTDKIEGVPVKTANDLSCFDIESFNSIPPQDSLNEDEALMLSIIHQSGGTSILSLSEGVFKGEKQIWMRISPEKISSIPRKQIVESVFNVLTEESKKWVRKYHHLLIGSNISENGCKCIESLYKRNLISFRPISIIASMYDGVVMNHPGWLPVEVYATHEAWKYHKPEIVKYLFGKSSE